MDLEEYLEFAKFVADRMRKMQHVSNMDMAQRVAGRENSASTSVLLFFSRKDWRRFGSKTYERQGLLPWIRIMSASARCRQHEVRMPTKSEQR